jgi:hypothetical protein
MENSNVHCQKSFRYNEVFSFGGYFHNNCLFNKKLNISICFDKKKLWIEKVNHNFWTISIFPQFLLKLQYFCSAPQFIKNRGVVFIVQ